MPHVCKRDSKRQKMTEMRKRMIGADAIVRCLEEEGVEYLFGYPGVAICPFYNSILDYIINLVKIKIK